MVIVLIASLLFNVVLFAGVIQLLEKNAVKPRGRRGYISAHTNGDEKRNIRALIEEVENLGVRSRVKYLEITGIESCDREEIKDILGTIIDHHRIRGLTQNQLANAHGGSNPLAGTKHLEQQWQSLKTTR